MLAASEFNLKNMIFFVLRVSVSAGRMLFVFLRVSGPKEYAKRRPKIKIFQHKFVLTYGFVKNGTAREP